MPGTLLVENYPTTFAGGTWTPVPLNSYGVVIESGSFYVGWVETDQTPPVGVDSDSPADNSFIDVGINVGFEPFGNYFEGAIMIRAEVDSANALVSNDIKPSVPEIFELKQNYPNPFNPVTTIDFSLVSNGVVSITLYDLAGRKVRELLDDNLEAGYHSFTMNAKDLSSGIYLYAIDIKDKNGSYIFSSTRKMALIK